MEPCTSLPPAALSEHESADNSEDYVLPATAPATLKTHCRSAGALRVGAWACSIQHLHA